MMRYQTENCSSREHRLCHLDTQTWLAFIRPHLKGKRSLILKVRDPLGLKGAEACPLDQSAEDKHPFLAVSGPSDLQTVWQWWPVARGQCGARMLCKNDQHFCLFKFYSNNMETGDSDVMIIKLARRVAQMMINQWLTGPGWGRKSPGRSPVVPVLDTPSHGTGHSPHTLRHSHTSTVTTVRSHTLTTQQERDSYSQMYSSGVCSVIMSSCGDAWLINVW